MLYTKAYFARPSACEISHSEESQLNPARRGRIGCPRAITGVAGSGGCGVARRARGCGGGVPRRAGGGGGGVSRRAGGGQDGAGSGGGSVALRAAGRRLRFRPDRVRGLLKRRPPCHARRHLPRAGHPQPIRHGGGPRMRAREARRRVRVARKQRVRLESSGSVGVTSNWRARRVERGGATVNGA